MIIAIAGPPGSGKSWLADRIHVEIGHEVIRTDDYIKEDWHDQPLIARRDLDDLLLKHDTVIVEGMQIARMMRQGMTVDLLVRLSERSPLSKGQRTMWIVAEQIINNIDPRPDADVSLTSQTALFFLLNL